MLLNTLRSSTRLSSSTSTRAVLPLRFARTMSSAASPSVTSPAVTASSATSPAAASGVQEPEILDVEDYKTDARWLKLQRIKWRDQEGKEVSSGSGDDAHDSAFGRLRTARRGQGAAWTVSRCPSQRADIARLPHPCPRPPPADWRLRCAH